MRMTGTKLRMSTLLIIAMLAMGLTAFADDTSLTADGYIMKKTASTLTVRIPGEEALVEFTIPEAMQEGGLYQVQVGDRVTLAYERGAEGASILTSVDLGEFEVIRGTITEVQDGSILITPYEGTPYWPISRMM